MRRMVPRVETLEKWERFSQKARKVVKIEDEDEVSQTPAGLDNDAYF